MAAIFGDTLTVLPDTATAATMTLLVPPAPLQVSEYDVVAVMAPVLRLPLVGNAPLQPPEAVHAVALVELQVSVEAPPEATRVGFAVNVAVGAAGTVTVAATVALVPPGPVQVSEYDVFTVRAPVLRLPLAGNAPLQPPVATHAVASVELQVKVDAPPRATRAGYAVNVAVGSAGAATETVAAAAALVPPGPMQVSEYAVVAVSAPVLWLPLVANAALQPPEPLQAVALVELQVSVDVPPKATAVGFALTVAVGAAGAATETVAAAAALVPPGPVQVNEYAVVAVRAPVL
ncbi:MAG TPA: hypothetical protein VNZ53_24120 [Steroidobacteraceae bacterium]|nr:hypothetical protein [Steroidobacteraceae bacterium]